MLSIEEIKNVTFRKSSIGGYKPEDVDTFIDQVLITMEQLRKEKSDLVKKMDILATRVEEYRADEDAVRNALLSAQRVADTTIKEARTKAAHMIEESENMAKAKLYDLNVQIKNQKKQYTLLLAECNRVREEIINHCNKHIVIAKELPSLEKIQSMEVAIDERFPTDNSNDYERAEEIAKPAPAETESVKAAKAEPVKKEENVAPAAAPIIEKEEPATAPEVQIPAAPATEDNYDVNIVSDIEDREPAAVAPHDKKDKKKTKSFGVLKFGDDYDLNNDDDNGDADSDNT